MLIKLALTLALLQQADIPGGEPSGEVPGIYWLVQLVGTIFFCIAGYGVYRAMLYTQVAANRHPANFRKVVIAMVLLCCIIQFSLIFYQAFGWPIIALAAAVWLVLVVIFIFTRRKPATH